MRPSQSEGAETPEAERPPEGRSADTLLSAALLAFAGGALDAFLYLLHGQVFAGAMTGNAVLWGVAMFRDKPAVAFHHFLPLVGFVCGVWIAELLQDRLRHHAVSIGLALEACGLLVCSFLPGGFPDAVFVPLVSLLAAYQVASFRKADTFSYNSTFISGDLRMAVVGLYRALQPGQPREGLRQARDLFLVITCFLAGAVGSSLLVARHGNHTLWLPVVPLLAVLGVAVSRTESRKAAFQAGENSWPGTKLGSQGPS